MTLTDEEGRQGGPWRHIAVVFNARPDAVEFPLEGPGNAAWRPHPDQPARMSGRWIGERLEVPGRSVAVFVAGDA